MPPMMAPFTVNQRVRIPAGTLQLCEGRQEITRQDFTAQILRVMNGWMEVINGAVVSHSPVIVAVTGNKPASYEVSATLLEANGLQPQVWNNLPRMNNAPQ
jgi:hypothetical protein